jgi:hypothetical protein
MCLVVIYCAAFTESRVKVSASVSSSGADTIFGLSVEPTTNI